jgi:putative hydrolase of the HAD superfamily
VGLVKPERAIYELALSQLGLTASECVFVGGGGSNELAGARAVGLCAVFVSGVMAELWPETIQARRQQADHHIEKWSDLKALLDGPIAHR